MPSSDALSIIPAGKKEAGQWSIRSRFNCGFFESRRCGVVNHTGPGGSATGNPTGSDFTLARGKIRSQRGAFKSVRGSNQGV
jgi:hypothetical protein